MSVNLVGDILSSSPLVLPLALEQDRWSAVSSFFAELFTWRAYKGEDLDWLPCELKMKICQYLDLRSLANLGETCRLWNGVVRIFLIGYLNLNRELPVPPFGQTRRIIDDLNEKIAAIQQIPDDIRLMVRNPTMGQIHYLQKWVEARKVIDQWTGLLKRIEKEFPNLAWDRPDLWTRGCSALEIAIASRFEEWLEVNQPFLAARDTLQVWRKLANGSVGFDHLTSPMQVIEKGEKFSEWFEQHREDLIQRSELALRSCYLTSLPPEIGELSNLIVLSLDRNLLTNLPDSFYKLKKLADVDLSNNRIFSLSDAFFNLTSLKILDLGTNKFSSVTKKICRFRKLECLDLSKNRLFSLPGDMRRLSNLEMLRLDSNYLFKLNEGIGGLRKLKVILVGRNHLTQLPERLECLPELLVVDVGRNFLNSISPYPDMSNLIWISAKGNRISSFQLCRVYYHNVRRIKDRIVNLLF